MATIPEKKLTIPDSITVGELAETLNLSVTTLVGELFRNGIAATINQRIDFETATIIVEELGIEVELIRKETESRERVKHENSATAGERPPIVAVMGHVDHGKTSLLDAIMDLKVASGEAGGITQHISAYTTTRGSRAITLLDTPGHEAFAALRQHGAALTDVVIIVVAADDGVKPQTTEAIRFAREANAKIVVAINKMDKEAANPGLVKGQLAEQGVMSDDKTWGGDVPMVEVSAKTRKGLDELLDTVLLVADLEELKADRDVPAEGLVIESHMEQGRGAVVSLLVEQGVLKPGAFLVAGASVGKVRTLLDFAERPFKEAGPSTPAVVTGFKEVPQFGDLFTVAKSEKEARSLANQNRLTIERERASTNVTSSDLLKMMTRSTEAQEVALVVKADVQGSLTSVNDSIRLIESGEELNVRIIGSGVGPISENDVRLAGSSGAIVYGFNVTLPPAVKQLAARDKVPIRIFKIIYELLDDVRQTMEEMLSPEVVETEVGTLTVKGVFRTLKDEIIAGGEVTSGRARPNILARVKHGGSQIAEVDVTRVQRASVEAKEIIEGELCGLTLKTRGKLALEEGDTLEFFTRELVKKTLS